MDLLRAFFLRHRAFAMLLAAAALCLKALLPAGTMVASTATAITVQICADATGSAAPRHHAIPMKGDPAKSAANGECPYATLGMAGLAGTDFALLALALLFILATGYASVRAVLAARPFFLTPPLRGPPAFA